LKQMQEENSLATLETLVTGLSVKNEGM